MKYKIWDSKNAIYLAEDELYNIGIGSDGILYEFDYGSGWEGSAWLEKSKCPSHYEIHLDKD
jgi:hypothetical protein